MKLHIVSAALPPKLDGIGDYTACLARELSADHQVTILTDREAGPDPIPGVTVEPCFSPARRRSTRAILGSARRARPDWVVLQYNPFAFGGRGFNLHLPLVMWALRRRLPDTRLAIMCHEVFTPVSDLKFTVMTTWQRAQLFALGRTADCMFFSIEAWTRRFARWFPRTRVAHLPVGSNVPVVAIERTEARSRVGIDPGQLVLGVFGRAHPSRMLQLTREAADRVREAGYDAVVLYVGPDTAAIEREFAGLPIITTGLASPDEVSRRFAAMDVHLAAFVDGISTRRGSLMTGLQHGVPTVSTRGAWTDRVFDAVDGEAVLLASVDEPAEFYESVLSLACDRELRHSIGARGRDLYEREFDWPIIAGRLVQALVAVDHRTTRVR